MLFRRRSTSNSRNRQVSYWISFSDLMAGLLLVFILLLIGSLIVSRAQLEDQRTELEQQQTELERQQATLDETMEELETLDTQISEILGIRAGIIERLKDKFEETDAEIRFDDATGAIQLGSEILFDEGSAELTERGRETLESFIPVYFDALLGDEDLREHIGQVVFEGHTNSNYSASDDPAEAYLFNLQLSQDRAYNAMEYVIANEVGEEYEAKELLAAVGYSSSRLIYKDEEQTVEDTERSRRIEIRFRLKDEEAIEHLRELMDEDGF